MEILIGISLNFSRILLEIHKIILSLYIIQLLYLLSYIK